MSKEKELEIYISGLRHSMRIASCNYLSSIGYGKDLTKKILENMEIDFKIEVECFKKRNKRR